ILTDNGEESVRTEVTRFTVRSVARGEPVQKSMTGVPVAKKYLVVFKGTLGSERDIGVAVGSTQLGAFTITPNNLDLTVGQEATVTAQLVDTHGFPIYVSGDNLKSTMDPPVEQPVAMAVRHGLKFQVTEQRAGTTTLTVEVPETVIQSSIRITVAPVYAISIFPLNPIIELGSSVELAAKAMTANGTIITNALMAWSSSNSNVATVVNGLVHRSEQ